MILVSPLVEGIRLPPNREIPGFLRTTNIKSKKKLYFPSEISPEHERFKYHLVELSCGLYIIFGASRSRMFPMYTSSILIENV